MEILFITTQFPYPVDNGGKHGALSGLKVVSWNNNVTVLSFTEQATYVDEGIRYFKKILPNVKFVKPINHDIHIRKKPLKLFRVMAKDFFTKIPYVASKFDNKSMFREIDEQFNGHCWDIVFVDYLNMYMYGEYIRAKYKSFYKLMILKDHNIEYEIVKQAADNSKGIKRTILNREWVVTKKYEENAIKNSDIVFSVCEENTLYMKRINDRTYTMLPTYENHEIKRVKCSHNKILYMGNLTWGANMDGLKWFVDNVFPVIRDRIPDVVLTIVGNGPDNNPFSKIQGINYIGYVKDITNIYDDQSVFIVPLFEGSGIRIKILEAFDNEIAVVSTHIGCGTISAKNNRELIIADDAKSFASGVITLLEHKDLNDQMTIDAKNFLISRFGLRKRQNEFLEIVEGVF